jgi:thioredoxin-like negative regulator of GroEL
MQQVTDNDFHGYLKTQGLLVAVFHSSWCQFCKALTPGLPEIQKKFNDMKFISIDVDEAPKTCIELNIQTVPTVIVFSSGKLITSLNTHGGLNQTSLTKKLDDVQEQILKGV